MRNTIVVHVGRTNLVTVSLGIDVSNDVITSEVRTASGDLIMAWEVDFDGDGTDGEIVLRVDDSVTALIDHPTGLMDLKRVSNGEPYAIFDKPLEVEFRRTVTT